MDGVVTSMLSFRKELQRRGHRVYIFASRKGISRNGVSREKDIFLYPGVGFKPYPQYSVAVFPFYSLLKRSSIDIDIVHAQTPFMMGINGMLMARLSRYPLVGSFHTMVNSKALEAYYPKNKALRKFYSSYLWKYTKFFYRKCDLTIAPSHAIEDLLARHGITNTALVPNGVDLKRFNKEVSGAAMRRRLGIRDGEKAVLYLGRISREKKIETLLRAARRLLRSRKDVVFVIGGTGPAQDYYKRMARRLRVQGKVRFIGFVDERELPHLYAASDILCLPSTFETQGIVSLEAMALGKPVVGADYLALREIIQNGRNGERFAPGDDAGCAAKIEKVLNNCAAYRSDAIRTAGKFSVEKVTDRLLKAYDSVF